MALINRIRRTPSVDIEPRRFSLEALIEQVNWLGQSYPLGLNQTLMGGDTEEPDSSFTAMVRSAYAAGGPVFACIAARGYLFSEARFSFQQLVSGRPDTLFGTPALRLLEQPWPNGTTREMLWRAEQDASLAGNHYLRVHRGRLWRLRPDWMTIVLGSNTDAEHPSEAIDAEVVGYVYGPPEGAKTRLLVEEVAHWSPIPDPIAHYRGMSWLTPILREVQADHASVVHKAQFFRNAATPNLVVMPDATVSYDEFKQFQDDFRDQHEGAYNAYKTLFLGGGSKIERVGLDFKAMDFKGIQGIGETRIAAAANVPPIIAGFSEGLASATYSNYGQARRKFGDHFARPQWGSFAASLQKLVAVPSGSRLWYDDRDIAFLREDQGDEADIRSTRAQTIRTLIEAGFEPDAAVAYTDTGNADALLGQHTGMSSVQLTPPTDLENGDTGGGSTGHSIGDDGRGALEDVDGLDPIAMATLLQKLYLATPGKVVVSTEEARRLARRAGIDLDDGMPDELAPAPAPAPAPGASAVDDSGDEDAADDTPTDGTAEG